MKKNREKDSIQKQKDIDKFEDLNKGKKLFNCKTKSQNA
jgi:hypothetical protein